MGTVGVVLTVVIVIIAVLLVLVVLAQNSKGGGISSSVGISNQVMGVQRSTENVEKITWGLLITLAVVCVLSGKFINTRTTSSGGPKVGYEPLKTQYELPENPSGQLQTNPVIPNGNGGGSQPANSGQ
jgi:preprotein translocase subunit SecG